MFDKRHKPPVTGCPAAGLQQWGTALGQPGEGLCGTWCGDLLRCLLVSKWARVGRLEFALWTIQLLSASFNFTSSGHRILAWDSYLTSSNFCWNYSIYLRHTAHFNFCWQFFCALQQCVQKVIIFTMKDMYLLSNLAFSSFIFPAFWHLFPLSNCSLRSGDALSVFD